MSDPRKPGEERRPNFACAGFIERGGQIVPIMQDLNAGEAVAEPSREERLEKLWDHWTVRAVTAESRVAQLEQEIAEWKRGKEVAIQLGLAAQKRAEAAEARVAALEKERDAYHERADAEQVAGILRGEKAEKEVSDLLSEREESREVLADALKEASDLRAALDDALRAIGYVPHMAISDEGSSFVGDTRRKIEALLSAGEHDQEGR